MIDQLKRRATEVNHFFNKKRGEASAPSSETAAATSGNIFFRYLYLYHFADGKKRGGELG